MRFDGSERVAREISMIDGATIGMRASAIEVVTAFGRKIVNTGQWVTRDLKTGALRVYDHDDFLVEHERIAHV